MAEKIIYHEGQKVGHLIFIKELTKGKHRRALFKCHCGNSIDAQIDNVLCGKPKSCGCDKATHLIDGQRAPTREYNTWQSMIKRCYDPNNEQYHNYGGRGITVHDDWRKSFKAFIRYVGRKPATGMSLDRIDTNGNYEPGNVRWATQKEQLRNTRNNVMITYKGETKCVAEWAEIKNINVSTLQRRINRGWAIDRAFNFKPVNSNNQWQPRIR